MEFQNSIYQKLVDELIKAKILSKKAELSDSKWTDVHLPTLYDKDLENMKSNFYIRSEVEITSWM